MVYIKRVVIFFSSQFVNVRAGTETDCTRSGLGFELARWVC